MPIIKRLTALEILDSRGRPTVKATCELAGGAVASASVPSGASTGAAEALELRDGDPKRFGGLGCRKAVANVNGEIAKEVAHQRFEHQKELDGLLLRLDGTPNKSRLGANAILAASIAFARAHAIDRRVPLYAHFADMVGTSLRHLPRMTINLFSGGKHAGAQVPIQDLLLVPMAAATMDGLAQVYAVYYAAAKLTGDRYGVRLLRADEGGLAPPFPNVEAMFDNAVDAITAAGLTPGKDVAIAIDVASSHFFENGRYVLGDATLDSTGMIERVASWVDRAPVVSVEDGLSEDDWSHWPALRRRLEEKAIVLGDDFLCTNPQRIARAIETGSAGALLLKVNQIGTLTEAAEARRLSKEAGWNVTVSARSGETEDDWLADLAVGWNADQVKIGSITQSERLAKYNRLVAIESETKLKVNPWPAR